MNPSPDPANPPSADSSNGKPRRPAWFWFLLFLPPAATFLATTFDGLAYRSRSGGDGTHYLASGLSIGLSSLALGLVMSIFLTGWEVRNRSGKIPAVVVAVGSYLWLQIWYLSLTFAGCTLGSQAGSSLVR